MKCYDFFIIPKNMKMVKNPIYQNRYTDNKRNGKKYISLLDLILKYYIKRNIYITNTFFKKRV
ncbi:hypothetical protein PFFVO_02030 [Plasmodium falciparum Vietnam Oak-Knoll (FVO)]|uniref:Uncharacterized protein n=1 Tax=Plasmodium falciparum Vietnam Oak-Knoll (FVO) TaxID=1036723 RepID=A0A024V847_PLAFA|nr:hypothetical protein PFFVO_02030 [Plasmodium falciparum Vietnam Oak-Knoll (FVO)]